MLFVFWIILNTVVNYIAVKEYKNSSGTIATHFLAFSLSLLIAYSTDNISAAFVGEESNISLPVMLFKDGSEIIIQI